MSRVLLFALLSLPGCSMVDSLLGDGDSDGPVIVTPTAKAPTQSTQLDALQAAIKAEEDYVYNPIGKRDPFRSFLTFGARSDDDTPRTPLQKYEIDQYELVGIIWGIERPRALVQDPEGIGHVMEIGTYIGRNWGKVTRITNSEVVVTEEYQTIDGELVVNNINLTLAVGEDGGKR